MNRLRVDFAEKLEERILLSAPSGDQGPQPTVESPELALMPLADAESLDKNERNHLFDQANKLLTETQSSEKDQFKEWEKLAKAQLDQAEDEFHEQQREADRLFKEAEKRGETSLTKTEFDALQKEEKKVFEDALKSQRDALKDQKEAIDQQQKEAQKTLKDAEKSGQSIDVTTMFSPRESMMLPETLNTTPTSLVVVTAARPSSSGSVEVSSADSSLPFAADSPEIALMPLTQAESLSDSERKELFDQAEDLLKQIHKDEKDEFKQIENPIKAELGRQKDEFNQQQKAAEDAFKEAEKRGETNLSKKEFEENQKDEKKKFDEAQKLELDALKTQKKELDDQQKLETETLKEAEKKGQSIDVIALFATVDGLTSPSTAFPSNDPGSSLTPFFETLPSTPTPPPSLAPPPKIERPAQVGLNGGSPLGLPTTGVSSGGSSGSRGIENPFDSVRPSNVVPGSQPNNSPSVNDAPSFNPPTESSGEVFLTSFKSSSASTPSMVESTLPKTGAASPTTASPNVNVQKSTEKSATPFESLPRPDFANGNREVAPPPPISNPNAAPSRGAAAGGNTAAASKFAETMNWLGGFVRSFAPDYVASRLLVPSDLPGETALGQPGASDSVYQPREDIRSRHHDDWREDDHRFQDDRRESLQERSDQRDTKRDDDDRDDDDDDRSEDDWYQLKPLNQARPVTRSPETNTENENRTLPPVSEARTPNAESNPKSEVERGDGSQEAEKRNEADRDERDSRKPSHQQLQSLRKEVRSELKDQGQRHNAHAVTNAVNQRLANDAIPPVTAPMETVDVEIPATEHLEPESQTTSDLGPDADFADHNSLSPETVQDSLESLPITGPAESGGNALTNEGEPSLAADFNPTKNADSDGDNSVQEMSARNTSRQQTPEKVAAKDAADPEETSGVSQSEALKLGANLALNLLSGGKINPLGIAALLNLSLAAEGASELVESIELEQTPTLAELAGQDVDPSMNSEGEAELVTTPNVLAPVNWFRLAALDGISLPTHAPGDSPLVEPSASEPATADLAHAGQPNAATEVDVARTDTHEVESQLKNDATSDTTERVLQIATQRETPSAPFFRIMATCVPLLIGMLVPLRWKSHRPKAGPTVDEKS